MDRSRRRFLKIAGISGLSVLGVGTRPVTDAVAVLKLNPLEKRFSQKYYENHGKALKADRWAMVINTKKCKKGCLD